MAKPTSTLREPDAKQSAFEELKNEGVIPETRAWVLEVSESDRRAGSHIHQEAYTAWSGIRVFPHRLANLVGLRVHEHDS